MYIRGVVHIKTTRFRIIHLLKFTAEGDSFLTSVLYILLVLVSPNRF